ncbi:MAG: metallophosphoesterase, partial [Clostridia bacterium]|nr:metallophosphoesterase [Clostridia bacterium]
MKVFAISDLHLSTSVEKPMNVFGDGWTNHFEKISADWSEKVKDNDLVLLGGDMSWGMTIDEAAPDYALVSALSGRKIVGKGNHDYYWNSLSKIKARFVGFEFLQNNAFRILPNEILSDATPISKAQSESTDTPECSNCNNLSHCTPDYPDYCYPDGAEARGVIVAGTRGWTIPSKDTPEADVKIYKRELIRLELSLQKAQKLRKDGDILIVMLHYPPFDADYADTEMTALIEKYNADFVLYGHLH